MPFVAKDAETNERIDITQIDQPRMALAATRLQCQLCSARMIVRQGFVVRRALIFGSMLMVTLT